MNTVCIVRDEDCSECGWPETYAELLDGNPPTLLALGCRKCDWREDA